MYEPDDRPPYLALIILTILTLYRSYTSYKDCRLRSLYGEEYKSIVEFNDEIRME